MAQQESTLDATGGRAELEAYVRGALRAEGVYRGYKPKGALIEKVAERLPEAHVVVVSGTWCPDCRREVPKMARIVEQLPPGWTVEQRGDDAGTRDELEVRAIPTFVVLDRPGGRELGRVIESPASAEGLEGELLAIAESAAEDEAAA